MNEFQTIEKYFLPLTQGRPEAAGLKNDTASLSVPKGHELVVSSDTLVAGVHFLKNERPDFIAHKALRVNLSDLAAAGAEPYCYQLCVAFPSKPHAAWLRKFTGALLKDQKKFGLFCSGGDTTRTPGPLTIMITIFGLVPKGKAVMRVGAKPGDALVITGAVGDAFIGLQILQNKIKAQSASCVQAYRMPVPRTAIHKIIRTHARAAIDISDGLLADIGHIATASGCSVEIDGEHIQFSKAAEKLIQAQKLTAEQLLSGGDDYELAVAVSPRSLPVFIKELRKAGLKPLVIGRFVKGSPGVRLYGKGGQVIQIKKMGWSHF
jgi:thiamine-monophosphate kinase